MAFLIVPVTYVFIEKEIRHISVHLGCRIVPHLLNVLFQQQ